MTQRCSTRKSYHLVLILLPPLVQNRQLHPLIIIYIILFPHNRTDPHRPHLEEPVLDLFWSFPGYLKCRIV